MTVPRDVFYVIVLVWKAWKSFYLQLDLYFQAPRQWAVISLAGIPTATKHALNSSKTTTDRPPRDAWHFIGSICIWRLPSRRAVMSLNIFLTSTKNPHIPSKPTIGMSRRLLLEFRGMNFMPFSNFGRRQRLFTCGCLQYFDDPKRIAVMSLAGIPILIKHCLIPRTPTIDMTRRLVWGFQGIQCMTLSMSPPNGSKSAGKDPSKQPDT